MVREAQGKYLQRRPETRPFFFCRIFRFTIIATVKYNINPADLRRRNFGRIRVPVTIDAFPLLISRKGIHI